MVRTHFSKVLLALCFFGFSVNASATHLDLVLADTPDIASGFIDVSYDADSGMLAANGFAATMENPSGTSNSIDDGFFFLNASIDSMGAMSGGTLVIEGTIAALGMTSGTLLTGNLMQFGYQTGGGDPLEFIFSVTGGDAAALFGTVGGIILTMGSSGLPATEFSANFDNFNGTPGNGSGVADVAPVPVPAAVWLMVSALMGLGALRRR